MNKEDTPSISAIDQLRDFRIFLGVVWAHLNLKTPSALQLDIADTLQTCKHKTIIQSFRGVGKSYITSVFCLWVLFHNKDTRILIVSATMTHARTQSRFIRRLISEIPVLRHMAPRLALGAGKKQHQQDSVDAFTVSGAGTHQMPSVNSKGITGQLTGLRAHIIIADDVEILGNSASHTQRAALERRVTEFTNIILPDGKIIYLGTPQIEDSIYTKLHNRGYKTIIWPALYPNQEQRNNYDKNLASYISSKLSENQELEGQATEEVRFSLSLLTDRKFQIGESIFKLQYMLDTSDSDIDKCPLKLSDFITMTIDNKKAPLEIYWSNDQTHRIEELPSLGLKDDLYYEPSKIQGDYAKFDNSIMAIDPSGKGDNETAYAIVKLLSGYLFIVDAGGYIDGNSEESICKLLRKAKEYKVNKIVVEENYGGDMYINLLKSQTTVVGAEVTIEGVRSSKQKEHRIIDTIHPLLRSHKLILNRELVKKDYDESVKKYAKDPLATQRSLFYQISRVTKDRGSLRYDDRVDALSIAIAQYSDKIIFNPANDAIERERYLRKQLIENYKKKNFSFYRNKVMPEAKVNLVDKYLSTENEKLFK